jgi:hypothetical protein
MVALVGTTTCRGSEDGTGVFTTTPCGCRSCLDRRHVAIYTVVYNTNTCTACLMPERPGTRIRNSRGRAERGANMAGGCLIYVANGLAWTGISASRDPRQMRARCASTHVTKIHQRVLNVCRKKRPGSHRHEVNRVPEGERHGPPLGAIRERMHVESSAQHPRSSGLDVAMF